MIIGMTKKNGQSLNVDKQGLFGLFIECFLVNFGDFVINLLYFGEKSRSIEKSATHRIMKWLVKAVIMGG